MKRAAAWLICVFLLCGCTDIDRNAELPYEIIEIYVPTASDLVYAEEGEDADKLLSGTLDEIQRVDINRYDGQVSLEPFAHSAEIKRIIKLALKHEARIESLDALLESGQGLPKYSLSFDYGNGEVEMLFSDRLGEIFNRSLDNQEYMVADCPELGEYLEQLCDEMLPESSTPSDMEATRSYEEILSRNVAFIHINEKGGYSEMTLSELYREGTEQEMAGENRSYAFIDLDGDGEKEVVLTLAMGNSEYPYGFEILSGGSVNTTGYYLNLRALNDLRVDGTYVASGGAYDWGVCRMKEFRMDGYVEERITWCQSGYDENGELVVEYYVEGVKSDEAAFNAAIEARNEEAEPVTFVPLSEYGKY